MKFLDAVRRICNLQASNVLKASFDMLSVMGSEAWHYSLPVIFEYALTLSFAMAVRYGMVFSCPTSPGAMAVEPVVEVGEGSRRMICEDDRRVLRWNARAEPTIPPPTIVIRLWPGKGEGSGKVWE
jgi:hypothetical protein